MAKTSILEQQENEKLIIDKSLDYYNLAVRAKREQQTLSADTLLDFYLGQQIGHKPTEIDVVINHITTVIDSSIALILQTPLTIETIPTVESLDKGIQYYWLEVLDMQEKLQELLLNLKIYGTGFLYPHFTKENGLINLKMDVLAEGVFPDPAAKTEEDAEFIFYSSPIPLVKIQRWYPERGKLVKEESIVSKREQSDNKNLHAYAEVYNNTEKVIAPYTGSSTAVQRTTLPSANLIFGFIRDDTKQEIKVSRFKCRCANCQIWFYKEAESNENIRCLKCNSLIPVKYIIQDTFIKKETIPVYPKGRMVVFANNNFLLEDRSNPYYDFPFLRFVNRRTTRFFGLSDVEYLMGEQIAMNKLTRFVMEIVKKSAKRPLISDEDAIRSFKSTAWGDVLEKQIGKDISWLDMPSVPFDIFRFLDLLRGQIDNKTGLRDRLGVKTATEAGFLEEEEQRRQLFILTNVEGKLKKALLHILHILVNYHTYPEKVAWDSDKKEYVFFKGVDYKNLLFNVRVKFQTDKVLSKVVRHNQALQTLQTILTLMSAQLIEPEKAKKIADGLMKDLNLQ